MPDLSGLLSGCEEVVDVDGLLSVRVRLGCGSVWTPVGLAVVARFTAVGGLLLGPLALPFVACVNSGPL